MIRVPNNGPVPAAPAAAEQDVTIGACGADTFLFRAPVHVVNSSSRKASYAITVSFEAADGTRVGEGVAFVGDLQPGQAADADAIGSASGAQPIAQCRIASVTRI